MIVVLPVDGTCLTGTAIVAVSAIGPVEPYLKEVLVVEQEFLQLVLIIGYISLRAVVSLVAVPGREVDAEAEPALPAGCGEFTHRIAIPMLVRRLPDGIIGEAGRPQTEAVVMLGCEYHTLHSAALQRAYPLVTVEGVGIEDTRVSISVAPLLVLERVRSEMDKRIRSHLHQFYLLGCRDGIDGSRGICLCLKTDRCSKQQCYCVKCLHINGINGLRLPQGSSSLSHEN